MPNKSVVAVIVTFNRKELLKESIQALLNCQYSNLRILVVDNASTDGTFEFIQDCVDNQTVLYENTKENLGGAGGFNYGIRQALYLDADYIWIMDDDCIVSTTALSALLDFATKVKDDFGYLSSYVKWTDGSPCVMNVQRTSIKKEISNFDKSQKVKLASFVSLFLNKKAVEDVGLPIRDFFIWGDDWEYTNRLSKKYHCYFVADSIVTHKCKKNMGVSIAEDNARLERYFYAYRNEKYFYKQCGLRGRLYFRLKVLYHYFKILSSQNKKEKFSIIKKGLKAAKSFRPKIEYVYSPSHKLNVVEFFGEPLAYGGQEAFMLNMYKNFKDANTRYYLVTPFDSTNKSLIEEAEQRGDKIIAYNYKFNSLLRKYNIKKSIKRVLKELRVDVLHIQSGSIYVLLNVAKIAKNHGIKKVIVHSHCAGVDNFKYRLIKRQSDKKINKYVDIYFACSKLAAYWKFPKEIMDKEQYFIVNNGIDVDRYKFNEQDRIEYRKNLQIEDKFVLCNVGRFSTQKNHHFTVAIMEHLKARMNCICILVGSGELKDEIVQLIKDKGLEDYFLFLEKRSDVEKIMMASDLFILPSLYEGLAVTSIESQATGLPTLCSDQITRETDITDLIKFIPLKEVEDWCDEIISRSNWTVQREKYSDIISEKGYNAKDSAEFLEKKYRGY